MQSLSQQLSEQAGSFFPPFGMGSGGIGGPTNVEVKVHMMGMPPPTSTAGKGFSGLFPLAGSKATGSPSPTIGPADADKIGQANKKSNRLPGSFFKGWLLMIG